MKNMMISFSEAESIVKKESKIIKGSENVLLQESLNRILAEDILSDIDMPPFDKSAMDGFACRREDINDPMKLVGVIRAGEEEIGKVGKGECSKIMTGGKMPQGADCVIVVEETKTDENGFVYFTKETTKDNFVFKGNDIIAGNKVLEKGTLIKPQDIAVMASVGAVNPLVYKQVSVAIITTGDEIVEPHYKPINSQIRNSNASQIIAQVKKMGAIPHYMGIAIDDKKITEDLIVEALQKCDVLLLTGGVSMGDFDFIPEILKKIGVETKFEKIAVKPGRPTVFGTYKDKYVFGLPGNPVSSFSIFEIFVKPILFKCMGYNYQPISLEIALSEDFTRRSNKRTEFFPVVLNNDGSVSPVSYHGSAHIHALCGAIGSMQINVGINKILKGEKVHVRLF